MAQTIITELPLYTDSLRYKYGTNIEGQSKQFEFYWNSRAASWHMDIRNEDQTVIVQGVPLVPNYPMLADHPMKDNLLSGYFILLSNVTNETPDVSRDSTVIPEFYTLMYVYLTE